MDNNLWYKSLKKSNLTPPDYVFGYVWTILYIMMFCSLIKYLNSKSEVNKKLGLIFFITQLLLNILWSPTFFKFKDTKKALYVLITLWLSLAITFSIFYKQDKTAALLLIPYLIWSSFALYLNYYIVRNNKMIP